MSPKWLSDIFNPPSSIPPRARVELAAQKTQYALGEQIKGFIKIMSDEEFLVNQAFVCLSCLTLNRIKKEFGIAKITVVGKKEAILHDILVNSF